MFALLGARFSLDGTQRVLDLEAGSGALTLPLAALVREVVAVDPEPEMIAEGRRLAAQAGVGNIDWRLGDSNTLLALNVGPVLLTVMGASFHWTDRERLLRDLDTLIEPGGAVVLATCGARHVDLDLPPWLHVVEEVRSRYLGPNRRPDSGPGAYPTCGTRRFCCARPSPGSRRSTGIAPTAGRWTRSWDSSCPSASPAQPRSAPIFPLSNVTFAKR
ncbi:class I SAM-dependent methyltransferase [Streptomyces sp. NPDC091259]|uniref:class I SAM-dependent methyltransferase n=1 Tax=Streptomyces sp. NPDC091259 TaxID=3365976 RepID=UPI0037FA9654